MSMELETFRDCYVKYSGDGKKFTMFIGNEFVEKQVEVLDNHICTEKIYNKKQNSSWSVEQGQDNKYLQTCPLLNYEKATMKIERTICEESYLSQSHLQVTLKFCDTDTTLWYEYTIYPQQAFIETQAYICSKSKTRYNVTTEQKEAIEYNGIEANYIEEMVNRNFCDEDVIDCIGLGKRHLSLEIIKLNDKTDSNDYLTECSTFPLYCRGEKTFNGNIFIFDDYANENCLMIVRNAPTQSSALNRGDYDLKVMANELVHVYGSGIDFDNLPNVKTPYYSSVIGVGKTKEIKDQYKRYYKQVSKGDRSQDLFIMSNTWGDRSQDTAVCESFILKEIDKANKIGVGIVQIDDGWEFGITANSLRAKGGVWEGYYNDTQDFWKVNEEKFPNGLECVISYAKQFNIQIALWFSPDSSNDFGNVEKDIETIWGLYQRYGVRYFKIDGVKIRNKLCEVNFIKFMTVLTEKSKGEITFNLDVTAEDRFGYLYQPQFGTLFVENRYTDCANYFPHNTLKNLWCLSSVLPTRQLQMELLNNRRNVAQYKNISFRPDLYTIDYLFAITMLSNPLVWMEMSNLHPDDVERLTGVVSAYRPHSKALFDAEVSPIGNMPSGMNFTGFRAKTDSNSGYLLLFREDTDITQTGYTYNIEMPENSGTKLSIIYTNADRDDVILTQPSKDKIFLEMKKPLTFVFAKYN